MIDQEIIYFINQVKDKKIRRQRWHPNTYFIPSYSNEKDGEIFLIGKKFNEKYKQGIVQKLKYKDDSPWELVGINCECGSDSIGWQYHSNWCPKCLD